MAKEETVTLPASALAELIATAVRAEVAKVATATHPDARMREVLDGMRGKDLPPLPEETIECQSPLTGAKMKVRLVKSKAFPSGRVAEMFDYERPAGWDSHKENGGLCHLPMDQMQINPQTGKHFLKYLEYVYKTYWQRDWKELSGKPASALVQWIAPKSTLFKPSSLRVPSLTVPPANPSLLRKPIGK